MHRKIVGVTLAYRSEATSRTDLENASNNSEKSN